MQRASLLCLPVNVRHFVFLCLQGNIILQHVNHNCGWFVCTQIGYIHAHLLAGTQLFCPTIIWNITASERLFKITKNKRTGGKKSSVEGKKLKEQWRLSMSWFWHSWFRHVCTVCQDDTICWRDTWSKQTSQHLSHTTVFLCISSPLPPVAINNPLFTHTHQNPALLLLLAKEI